jgi:hypothetical protein
MVTHRTQGPSEGDWTASNTLLLAIVLSAIAAGVHMLASPQHYEEWWGYGLFFIVAAAAQALYAIALVLRPLTRRLVLVGIWGNVAIIVLWLITRTVGIPLFGPEAGVVEEISTIDTVSKVVEVALIVCLWRLLGTLPRAGDVVQ